MAADTLPRGFYFRQKPGGKSTEYEWAQCHLLQWGLVENSHGKGSHTEAIVVDAKTGRCASVIPGHFRFAQAGE